MILGFKTEINGNPTNFVERIWEELHQFFLYRKKFHEDMKKFKQENNK